MGAPVLALWVTGRPRPQGSMQLSRDPRTGREFAKYGTETVMHRNLVVGRLAEAWGHQAPLISPVHLHCTFTFKRPQYHFGTGRNAERLKPNAPKYVAVAPDTDKLVRLIGDALTVAGVITDDKLIAAITANKVWGFGDATLVEVRVLDDKRTFAQLGMATAEQEAHSNSAQE